MRGRSYTQSPPPRYDRRGGRRSPSTRGRYASRPPDPDLPTRSLLVSNLHNDCKNQDLRRPFSRFGPIKSIYIPKDYYTGNPRGFGFVEFVNPADAAEAKKHMDGRSVLDRELNVVFSKGNIKNPTEMRAKERSLGGSMDQRRSPPRYSHSPRYSKSPPPRHRTRSFKRMDYSSSSKSPSPRHRTRFRKRMDYSSYSKSPPPRHRTRFRKRMDYSSSSKSPSPRHRTRFRKRMDYSSSSKSPPPRHRTRFRKRMDYSSSSKSPPPRHRTRSRKRMDNSSSSRSPPPRHRTHSRKRMYNSRSASSEDRRYNRKKSYSHTPQQ